MLGWVVGEGEGAGEEEECTEVQRGIGERAQHDGGFPVFDNEGGGGGEEGGDGGAAIVSSFSKGQDLETQDRAYPTWFGISIRIIIVIQQASYGVAGLE